MDKIDILIDALIEYLCKPTPFPLTEVISILSALLSLGGVIFVAVYSVRKTSKQQIAKARIEWIQDVRQATAEFILACYEALHIENDVERKQKLSNLHEKRFLLTLYFGPENKNVEVDLLCENSNDGKHKKLIELIEAIEKYHVDERQTAIMRVENAKESALNVLLNEEFGHEFDKTSEEEYRDCLKELEQDVAQTPIKIEKINEQFNRIEQLTTSMRIYLKLEWNRAKRGK